MTAYQELERRHARIAAIGDALGILGWDTQTIMPEGANDSRAEQTATLSVIAHELATDPRMGDLLAEAESDDSLDAWQRANLREMRRHHIQATAVPADLVEATSKAVSVCEMTWRVARAESDYAKLLPSLTEVLARVREGAEALGSVMGISAYDALLDSHDPGARAERIDVLFADLSSFLPDLIGRVLDQQAAAPAVMEPQGPFPVEKQRELGVRMMERLGFDFRRGRLDVSLHPFCGGATGDVRITTRYDEANFTDALMGILHETGHALYEQNRPRTRLSQPVGQSRGMAVHESQSLLMEMQACRSAEFITWLAPVVRETFGGEGAAWEADNLRRLYSRVERGFIRVNADEVTYPAHIILRYRLEKALVAGDLTLPDLPGAWNDGMAELVGVVPPNDRLGCLQDIHWPGGGWGYFPSYTLGAMTAAQLFDSARSADPEIVPALSRGEFAPLVNWLRVNVHETGCFHASGDELLRAATGRPLDASVFKRHLERRYL
ncbi:carboxypeptidase Taq [Azospirillum lipoferum]|uniref:Metal-dependent carboxypeptidase n=1 Tax=Azospirillum lipoferum TaxID=193 RepID=A0A5A9G1M3_AZOLI|nr:MULTISPECIES: carboxypeptidase M32 [Azospirillum]KAA0587562.1 carboxypeptidase M32 [Azospirillum lipoferum]MCP1608882.1 carboxypeptidase Taq [Azospirillum lipoferum]MDW5535803.1 carboxypeptidase M32 [Azospirillum sp. NL1]